jgi:REP element-mobilizing transposase RayT
MPRRPRIHLHGGFYHVILRGNGRQAIFLDNEDRDQWQDILREGLVRYRHRLHVYCWMTNHVHMVIQVGVDPLAGFMRFLASRYARFLNRKTQRPGHLFERRYRAILVQKDEYLIELLRYIHLNPVRATMVVDPADYQWSSHNAYLRLTHMDWLTVDHLAAVFGTGVQNARLAYINFMTDQPSDATLHLLRNGVPDDDRLLGDDEWVKSLLGNSNSIDRYRNLDDIVHDACQRHEVTEIMLASRSRSRRNSCVRAEIALAAVEHGCATVTEVAMRFGRAHSGLSRAMNRLRDKNK